MYKIFMVEDDFALAEEMKKQITSWGNDVYIVNDFQNIMPEFVAYNPDLVLLDIMLPFFNGYHWCKQIREVSGIPIVFLSSAADNMNIVMAMNMGGDDFIAKPVDSMVMNAKLHAILRRTYDLTGKVPVLEHKGAILNLSDGTISYNDKKLELTKNEFKILQMLMENKGKIVSRDTLMTKLWQDDCYVEENTLTVNVTRLRKKLDGIGLKDYILTRVGSGYIVE